jgi:r-opsin
MITLFVLSWLPYTIVAQLGITGHQDYVTPYVAEFPVMLAKSSAVWNPIVYSLTHPRYKAALAARLPASLRSLCCSKVPLQTTTLARTTTMSSTSGSQRNENSGSFVSEAPTEFSSPNSVSAQQDLNVELPPPQINSDASVSTTAL